jgi:beta-glucanase (GH16 family)
MTRRSLIPALGALSALTLAPRPVRMAVNTADPFKLMADDKPAGLAMVGGIMNPVVGPLVISENFLGPKLNRKLWRTDWDNGWHGGTSTGMVEWYADSQVQMVDDPAGALRLVARPATPADNVPAGDAYVSGMIGSLKQFGPSRISVTCRLPGGKDAEGIWPTIALFNDGAWPPEDDIAEVVDSSPNWVHCTDHWADAVTGKADQAGGGSGPYDLTKPHTFSLDWVPGLLVWYIDGRPVYSNPNAPTVPMQLFIANAVGDAQSWAGANHGQTAIVRVDNVTVSEWPSL